MCTIVVTLNENEPQILRKMATAVCHRGPDSFEVWTNKHHGVAGCRLSIFGDRDAPMIFQDPDTGQIVLLNGEIYNYHSLWRDVSKQGYYPRTDLEAELVARLYQIHGLEFVGRLKGMFALVIVDNSQLILARDRFGIKPLYYTKVDQSILVCSEIKGILCHPKVSPILNTAALEETRVLGMSIRRMKHFFRI